MLKKLFVFAFVFYVFTTGFIAASHTQIKAVVFDFGGVLANANDAEMKKILMSSFGITKDELSKALIDMRVYRAQGGSEKSFWEKYSGSKGRKLPVGWFDQYASVIRGAIAEIPETIVIVKELQKQGYQTAVLSDVTQYQAKIIQQMGYYDLFCPVLLSCDTGVKKPDPKAFKILLKRLKLPAFSVLFVDDRVENVEAAKKEGIDGIQFFNPKQFQEELQNREIRISTQDGVSEEGSIVGC